MVRPDKQLADRIAETGRLLAQALGDRAACVALYGSAAGDEFSPSHSDVNLLLVLREIEYQDLRLIGTTLEREATRLGVRFATPLVVHAEFLRAARDSFPIELEDIRTRHLVLAGDDLLATLTVPPSALRVAAEREARTLLLRLHALALHRPEDAAVVDALSHLVSSLSVVGAALLALPAGAVRPRGAALMSAVADRLRVPLAGFSQAVEMRAGSRPWPAGQALDLLLGALMHDLDAIVRAVDARSA